MALRDDLRQLIGAAADEYVAGGVTYWTNGQLDDALNRRRRRVLDVEVVWLPSWKTGGGYAYLEAEAELPGYVEPGTIGAGTGADVGRLVTSTGVAFPAAIDSRGRITFAADQYPAPTLYFSAYVYDLYLAAADVIERWASHVKLQVDVGEDGQSWSRSQRHKQLLDQAETFRQQGGIGTTQLVTDLA